MTETARQNDPREPHAPHPATAPHAAPTPAAPHAAAPHAAPVTAPGAAAPQPAPDAAAPRPAPAPRNARLEALRLVAILSIAVFHTFQPWFAAATDGRVDLGVPVLAALGLVSLLGAFGNHVFFMLSGYFLLPSAARRSREPGYWRAQLRSTAARSAKLLACVAVWAVAALLVSTLVVPVPGVSPHEAGWLVGGLEFVWVYLALVWLAPLLGWLWERLPHPRAWVCGLVCLALLANAYVAFVSPGSEVRGLLEWRKLLSAATYLVSFLLGAAIASWRRGSTSSGARALLAAVAACAVAEAACAETGATSLMVALSFKSTSALSLALAVACLVRASAPGRRPSPRACGAILWLTPSILGFYVAQSVFSPLWRPWFEGLCASALAAGGPWALLACGLLLSAALLAVTLVADRVARVAPLRRLGLA